jgi:hypothetical protein
MAHEHDAPLAHGSPHDSEHVDADVNIGAIFKFCLGLIVAAVAIQAVVWVLFQVLAGREAARVAPEYPLATSQETRLPPEPRLQTNPREDLRQLREHENAVLGSYGWVDKSAGVVRIPIDEAIKATARRGLPTLPAAGEPAK